MTRKYTVFISTLIAILITIVGIVIFRQGNNQVNGDPSKPVVITSFYPLYFFATEIGGDLITVKNITPAGAEPHDYELTPRDMVAIHESSLLIINGTGFEPWATDILTEVKDIEVETLVVGDRLINEMFVDEEGRRMLDPHIWLDPVMARAMVKKIEHALQAVDPTNADVYQANAERLDTALWQLDTDYRTTLSNCIQDTFVTAHAAFGYLAKRYTLRQLAITGLSPDIEPTSADLVSIANFVKDRGIKVIFFESLISPRLAETLARETGAESLVLNPLEGLTEEELSAGKNYLTEMENNLDHLRIALQCP